MGCGSSAPAEPPVQLIATSGGGSMILAAPGANPGGKGATAGRASAANGAELDADGLLVTKGGSYVIGRKLAHAWEPGQAIDRPDNTPETQYYYIRLKPNTASSVGASGSSVVPSNKTVLRLSYGAWSEQGRGPRPPHKPNQDSFLAVHDLGSQQGLALFAAFDGHGPRGEDAANFCRVNLADVCTRHPAFPRSPQEALVGSFDVLHKQFTRNTAGTSAAAIDTSVSGSTAIAIMISPDGQWVCANVGDSRAMMGTTTARGQPAARPLSVDHKPHRPDERARITKTGAKILSERALGIEGGDPDKHYVCRVVNGMIRYGVLFTRSIGDADAHTNLGLISTPEITRGVLRETADRYVVLATDGVWDYLNEEAIARIMESKSGGGANPDDAQGAVEAICKAAKRAWDMESHHRRDDITAVVVRFTWMTEEAAAAEIAARNSHIASRSAPELAIAAAAAPGANGSLAPMSRWQAKHVANAAGGLPAVPAIAVLPAAAATTTVVGPNDIALTSARAADTPAPADAAPPAGLVAAAADAALHTLGATAAPAKPGDKRTDSVEHSDGSIEGDGIGSPLAGKAVTAGTGEPVVAAAE